MSNFTTQNCVCYYYDYEAVSLGRDIAKIVYEFFIFESTPTWNCDQVHESQIIDRPKSRFGLTYNQWLQNNDWNMGT